MKGQALYLIKTGLHVLLSFCSVCCTLHAFENPVYCGLPTYGVA
jgi:hypothetical protein